MILLARGGRRGALTSLPSQVYRIATDPRLRRNHALEHATLHVLEERHGRPCLDGVAVNAGFVLRGWINPAQISAAACEGLARLQSGELRLAYHRRCGTSLGTADLLTWLVLVLLIAFTGRFDVAGLALVLAVTWLVAPWVGWLVQRYLTTSVDLGGVVIGAVQFRPLPSRRQTTLPAPEGTVWGEAVVLVEHRQRGGNHAIK